MKENLCFACMSPISAPDGICPHCGHDNRIRHNGPGLLPEGVLAGKYVIGKLLGRGGFGATYLGYDINLQRPVAIKEYLPAHLVVRENVGSINGENRVALASQNSFSSALIVVSGGEKDFQKGKERALNEARMAARLGQIPGVVQIYDVFGANNTIYIVMEYVEGDTLTTYVKKHGGKLTLNHSMELLSMVAEALENIHRRKIVHRDVKPDNIMVSKHQGRGVLLDFGAAKAADGSTLSVSSAVVSPGFAPIEQYNSTMLDGRLDQYAFAATLYFMLTGCKPPDATLRVVDENKLKPIRIYQSEVTPQVEEVILKGMSIRAKQRYDTMEEFWSVLKKAAKGKKSSGKNMGIKIVGVALLVLALVIGGSTLLGGMGSDTLPVVEDKEITALVSVTEPAINPVTIVDLEAEDSESTEKNTPEPIHNHVWSAATYISPKKCIYCGETEGESIIRRSVLEAGMLHTVGLNADGSAVAVGIKDDGRCEVEGWDNLTGIYSRGYHTVGLRADGTLLATGLNDGNQCDISSWKGIKKVFAGRQYTLGLKDDGTVIATGWNDKKQCEVGSWTDIVEISGGGYHTLGIRSDGTVVAAGLNEQGQCNVNGWRDIVAICGGKDHTVGLRSDGRVLATGCNDDGQCNVEGWTDIILISAGSTHTVALKADGTVVTTGSNKYGQCDVESWTDIVAVSAGGRHTVGLKADGTVVATGNDDYNQLRIEDWKLMLP